MCVSRDWDSIIPAYVAYWGFPGGSAVKSPTAMQEMLVDPWVGKISWKRAWQSIPVVLPGESHEQSQTWLSTHTCCLPGSTSGKELPANARRARDMVSIPGLGKSPGEENGNPLQYSCLKNPVDRGAWRAAVQRVTRSQT